MSRENGIAFEKGWIVMCPSCDLKIAECMVDQMAGEVAHSWEFKSLGEWDITAKPTRCPTCNAQYGRGGMSGQMFSDHGWQPDMSVSADIARYGLEEG